MTTTSGKDVLKDAGRRTEDGGQKTRDCETFAQDESQGQGHRSGFPQRLSQGRTKVGVR